MNVLTVPLDECAAMPLYLQLYAYIREEILTGRIPSGARLPSKRNLAAHLQISRNTVQNGYDQLVDEGYITAVPKSGYYVNKLDDMIRIGSNPPQVSVAEPAKNDCIVDFSPHGVDRENFPFHAWRRLIWETIDECDPDLLSSGDPQGEPPLRAAISAYLHESRGVNCSPDQILFGSGTEYLFQLLIQLFEPDRLYALENPGYEKLGQIFHSSRAAYTAVELDEHGMLPGALRRSGAQIACVTPSHQFPTGTIMPVSRRVHLLNWAGEAHNRYLVEDDYDSEFKYAGKSIPALQGLDETGHVIYMGTFSKALAPSMRISYMVLPSILLKEYRCKLSFYRCPVSLMEQKALNRFIREGYFERHLNKMRVLYRKKREFFVSSLSRQLPAAAIVGANAGLHLLLQPKNGMTERQLIDSARKQGVRVYGLSQYATGPLTTPAHPTLLLGFAALKTEEIADGVDRLATSWR